MSRIVEVFLNFELLWQQRSKCAESPYYQLFSYFLDMHVQNKKYGNISRLIGKCAAQKLKNFCSSRLWTFLHHMVILESQIKITDLLMILA